MVYTWTIRLVQDENGKVTYEQTMSKDGQERPSAEMEEALGVFYGLFGRFLSQYKSGNAAVSVSAEPGKYVYRE